MVDTKPYLKKFGEGTDVSSQIATDKAVNARRLTDLTSSVVNSAAALAEENSAYTQGLMSTANPSNGILVEVTATPGTPGHPHSLGRVPVGGIIVGQEGTSIAVYFDSNDTATDTTFDLISSGTCTVKVWLF